MQRVFLEWLFLLETRVMMITGEGFTDKCPTTESEWNEQADLFQCKRGKSYHCLKTLESAFFQKCAWKIGFDGKYGCPAFHLLNNMMELTQTKCFNNGNYCPDIKSNITIISDRVYRHPVCLKAATESGMLIKKSAGDGLSIHKGIYVSSSFQVSMEPTSIHGKTDSSYVSLAGGILAVFVLLVLGVIVLAQRRRIQSYRHRSGRANYTPAMSYNSGCSHSYNIPHIYDEIEEANQYELQPDPQVLIESTVPEDITNKTCVYETTSKYGNLILEEVAKMEDSKTEVTDIVENNQLF